MANSVQFDGPMLPSEQAALEAEAQRQAQAAGHDRPSGVSVHANCERVVTSYSDGRSSVQGVQRETFTNDPPGIVRINGVATTIEAARAAGLLPPEGFPGADSGLPAAAGHAPQGDQGDALTTSEAENDGAEDDASVPATVQEAVNAASAALGAYAEQHGAEVVTAHLDQAIESGEVPEVLPEGFTPAQADTVVAGYVASANHTLSEVGADVPMLESMLGDDELAQARRSTVYGDHATLQALGQQAKARLASLPVKDPAKFAALVATLPEEYRPTEGSFGQPTFNFPEPHGKMTWAQAVLRGIVKFR